MPIDMILIGFKAVLTIQFFYNVTGQKNGKTATF